MAKGQQKAIIRNAIVTAVHQLGWNIDPVSITVTLPPSVEFGDYASSLALSLGKQLKRKPVSIADDIKLKIAPLLANICSEITVTPPGYLNFKLSNEYLNGSLRHIIVESDKWGSNKDGKKLKVVIEYSSPNIAKLMHVGHLRNTLIGHALDNLHRHLGYDVITDNHIGDWGTQFGKLLVAYRLWSTEDDDDKIDIKTLEQLYIRFNREAKNNESLLIQARQETVKLQNGEPESRNIWQKFCQASMAEFNAMYELLGIRFDLVNGESFYESMLPGIVNDALEKKVAVESQGAIIIPLDEFGLPPYMIRKSDGGFLYSTSDLATIQWRETNLRPDLVLYVVGDQQELHFKQLFASAKKLGFATAGKLVHISYGMVLGEDGKKISTREGDAIGARQLINKAIALARNVIEEKGVSLSPAEKDSAAANIGISALIYNDLSHERSSAIRFDWDTMMNLKGSSAPYLFYTYVRIQGILRKARGEKHDASKTSAETAFEPEERRLLAALVRFPETLEDTADALQMRILVDYLIDLGATFHSFYDKVPVLNAPPLEREKRFDLLRATAVTMLRGFSILGMKPVERM